MLENRSGPLVGVTVLEAGGVGPVPLFGMLLADLGATVIRVDRPGHSSLTDIPDDAAFHDKKSVEINLGKPEGVDLALRLVERVDVLVEGFRPGVAERIGIGPDECMHRNPGLIYARITGWGGYGPLRDKGGHDLNYVALSGALHAIGPADRPPAIPWNLVGDYGGGAMMLVMGVLAALMERTTSHKGQVVEVAMTDGVLSLMSMWYAMRWNRHPVWRDQRGTFFITGGAPFYNTYETADGQYLAVGAMEPALYADLIAGLRLSQDLLKTQMDSAAWPRLKELFAAEFRKRSSAEWQRIFQDLDAAVTPVLSMAEAEQHPHNVARGRFIEVDGQRFVAPPVSLSRTPAKVHNRTPAPGQHTCEVLRELGIEAAAIEDLLRRRIVGAAAGHH